MYNTLNYTEQGGEKTHIGGDLIVENGGKIKFGSTEFKPAEAVADAASAPTKDEFNALLSALRAAGILKTA